MMHEMETQLVLKNRDGKRMPATLYTPEGTPKGVAVIFHGLGGWKDQNLLVVVGNMLVKNGYTVFKFDESHAVTSPDGDFFHETTTQYTRDAEDVVAYMKMQLWYQEPFMLVGHSMGGLVASWYAATYPKEVSRVVLLAPAVSWKTMWWGQLPWSLLWMVRGHQNILGIDGKKFALSPLWWKDFYTFDAFTFAPRIEAPVLIISAEKDHTVATPSEHRRYTRGFANAQHSTISWSDHDFDGHEEEVAATIKQWLTSS